MPIQNTTLPPPRLDINGARVVVGMSGGVDSSVSAALLKAQGARVEGIFMKNWEEDDGTEYCTALSDLKDAQAVCDVLDIPLHTVNFASEYWDNVFEYFLAEYRAYRTPNPDILCNKEIKFKAFLSYAKQMGANFIATGHYARRGDAVNHQAPLLRGLDPKKDQSYFLHAVSGDALAKTLFPLGHLKKTTVRELATHYALPTAKKKDSTGICFIGERRFKDFLARYIPAQKGEIIDTKGRVLGMHDGLMYHTLGQRGGLGIGGVAGADESPWFVLKKDIENARLIVGQGHNHPWLMHTRLKMDSVFWVMGEPPALSFTATAKTRYRQNDVPCLVTHKSGQWVVSFDEEVRAITPGQSCVLYQGEVCLGGGVITQADDA